MTVIKRSSVALLAVLAATGGLAATLLRPASGVGSEAAAIGALPSLSVADQETVMIGAVTAGPEAGATWAYRSLPLDAQPAFGPYGQLAYGPIVGSTSDPQLAFLRHTDATGWQVAAVPSDQAGAPYRGPLPNPRGVRMSARGGGVVVGRDGNRSADDQLVVLSRQVGAGFTELPDPPADVLLPAGNPLAGDAAEALAGDRGSGRVNVAVADQDSRTVLFAVPVGRSNETAVVVNDGSGSASAWSRETLDVDPSTTSSFRVSGIAASAPDNAWIAATSSGHSLEIFGRNAASGASWDQLTLPDNPFTSAAAASAVGISEVAPLDGQAQTITVSSEAIWVDMRFRLDGEQLDGTLLIDPDAPLADRIQSWCDASFCDQRLGFAFSTTDGYRSFAWAGSAAGERIITNPLRPGAAGTSNLGTYLRLVGESFQRLPGGGGNFRPSGAFASAADGWLQGPVEVGVGIAKPLRLRNWPVAARAPLTSVVSAPGGERGSLESSALAVGVDGAVARYLTGAGWKREFLLSASGSVVSATLRGVAWPEADRAHAVGDLGAMWLWRADTGLWERDPAAPVGFEQNLLAVAFDPADPRRGYAVGKGGTILAYDKTWTAESLPDGFASANFTGISFAGSEAIAVSSAGVLVNSAGSWVADQQLNSLLATLPRTNIQLVAADGLADGGAVIAGKTVVVERDSADGSWRFARQPLPGSTVIAAAAFRAEGQVRAVVSVVPVISFPAPDPPIESDPNSPDPLLPPYMLPGDGYVLRQTADGWRDEQRTSFSGSSFDRPIKSDPVLSFALGTDGGGWAVGGWSGAGDSAGRGTSARGGTGSAIRRRVQTASVQRYSPDSAPAEPANETASPVPLAAGPVRLAIGGHPQCMSACADLANQSLQPDRMVEAALTSAAALAARENGPRAFISTGSRIRLGSGAEGSLSEEYRHAQLLTSQPQMSVYSAVAAGDIAAGSASAFRTAFAGAPAPMGSAPPSAGIATDGIPGLGASVGAKTHYAFDTAGAGGTVRVIVIDNGAGSLAASDPHQNPAEAQQPWLVEVLDDARARQIPAVVVGSRDLNSQAQPRLNVASDADQIAELLVEHGASAYFYDRPEENRLSTIPAGASVTVPQFGTGTLGYRSSIADAASVGQPDSLFGAGGYLLAEIDVARRDAATNRAPVGVRLIPVIESLSVLAVDGTLLRRSRPALFQGVGRRPIAGDRWGQSGGDGVPSPPGADPYTSLPNDPCTLSGCNTRINPEFTFSSKDRDILDFVTQDSASTNQRKPLLGADDKVITDVTSGLVCPFNSGATTVTVAAGGRGFTAPVEVLPGSVTRPCGTRPLDPAKIKQVVPTSPAAAAPPPASSPPPTVLPSLVPPPPPPPTPSVTPLVAALPLFGGILNGSAAPPNAPPTTAPPPPPTFFANPVPPGGSTVKVEKREEEAAPESSSASASAYHSDDQLPLAPIIGAMLLLAAVAGTTIRPGRRRDPSYAVSRVRFLDRNDPRSPRRRLR